MPSLDVEVAGQRSQVAPPCTGVLSHPDDYFLCVATTVAVDPPRCGIRCRRRLPEGSTGRQAPDRFLLLGLSGDPSRLALVVGLLFWHPQSSWIRPRIRASLIPRASFDPTLEIVTFREAFDMSRLTAVEAGDVSPLSRPHLSSSPIVTQAPSPPPMVHPTLEPTSPQSCLRLPRRFRPPPRCRM